MVNEQDMNRTIPLASPNIGEEEIKLVNEVLLSGMLVQGKFVMELEDLVAKEIGVKHAICVSNGTATLHLILLALGIGPGDEVIVPAFSYIATANVVELVGATPVFVDIEERTFNINPKLIEASVTSRTKAIIVVHEFGLSADMDQIQAIVNQYQIPLIEDAACALGAEYKTKKTGSFGIAGSFSLHPRKAITSGEGGIVTTNDDYLAEKIRVLRNHGLNYQNGKMDFIEAGFNYRMTDIQAALVIPQFKRLPEIIKKRNQLAQLYHSYIDSDSILLPFVPEGHLHTWQTFHLISSSSEQRDFLIKELNQLGIGSNYGAQCIPATTFYLEKYHCDLSKYPNAMIAFQRGLALPLYEKLDMSDIEYITYYLNQLTHVA